MRSFSPSLILRETFTVSPTLKGTFLRMIWASSIFLIVSFMTQLLLLGFKSFFNSYRSPASLAGIQLPLGFRQELLVFRAELDPLQQVGPLGQGVLQGLLFSPTLDPGMVSRQKGFRHPHPLKEAGTS